MKKIIIFTSSGGYGHIATATALQEYFSNAYKIETCYIFKDGFGNFDPLFLITGGRYTGEDFYNTLMRKRLFGCISVLYYLSRLVLPLFNKRLERSILHIIDEKKVDLIISVIPLVNKAIGQAAARRNKPFVIVPTDLDSTTFVYGMNRSSYQSPFMYTLSFADNDIIKTIETAHIPASQVRITGYPVRYDFINLAEKTVQEREESYKKSRRLLSITDDNPVILLLLGGQGSDGLIQFAHQLQYLDHPIHLFICLGKSNHLYDTLKKMSPPRHARWTIVSFTNEISLYMAAADILITKSGSTSFAEGLYAGLPLILDATTSILPWERLNHIFLKKHELGFIVNNMNQLVPTILKLINDKALLATMRARIMKLVRKNSAQEISAIIEQFFAE